MLSSSFIDAQGNPVINLQPGSIGRMLVGIDIFVEWEGDDASQLAQMMKASMIGKIRLRKITEMEGASSLWRCRFEGHAECSYQALIHLLQQVHVAAHLCNGAFDIVKTENVYLNY